MVHCRRTSWRSWLLRRVLIRPGKAAPSHLLGAQAQSLHNGPPTGDGQRVSGAVQGLPCALGAV